MKVYLIAILLSLGSWGCASRAAGGLEESDGGPFSSQRRCQCYTLPDQLRVVCMCYDDEAAGFPPPVDGGAVND